MKIMGSIQMLRVLFLILFSILSLEAIETLQPSVVFKASGTVQSIVFREDKLYAGTSNGTVEIFDTNSNEKLQTISLPNIKDFMGDEIPAKVYSIDLYDNKILIVSQGMKGYRNIFLYENETLNKIIDIEKKYFIQKANFISKDKIIFGLLSNQIGVYDFVNKKLEYLIQISPSSFSHFMVDEEKKVIATTDESGIVRLMKVDNAQIIKQFKGVNLDRIYQLDYKNGKVLTAGQDRKSVIYSGDSYSELDFHFLLYSCGLSPSGNKGAVAFNEKNQVLVFNTNTLSKQYILDGQKATLTQILFKNENEVFVSSDDANINYFKLP